MLLELVQKNQIIIQDLEEKLRQKENEASSKIKEKESDFKTKVEYLESENRVLKELQDVKMTSEKDRVNFHKTLRNMLLEEIERIEREQIEKENNLAQWREHVMIEMQQERDELNQKLNNLEKAKNQLIANLAQVQNESNEKERILNSRIEYLTRNKESLESKVDETTKQINALQDSLVSKRKQNTTDESKWEVEKEELFKSLANVSEILDENTKIHAQQLRSMEDGYKTSLEILDKRIMMLNEEKRLLEQQIRGEKSDLLENVSDLNDQVHQLRSTNNYLIGLFDEREKQAAEDVEKMRDEIILLQQEFDKREESYVEDTRRYAENLEQVNELLQVTHEKMEENWNPDKSVTEALRNQVDSLQGQLMTKGQQMETLQKEAIKAQTSQRADITKTIIDFRNHLAHMNEAELKTDALYKAFLEERIEVDKISSERELDDMNKIEDSLNEIKNLRFKIRELEQNNKEKEFVALQSEMVKVQAELTHSKLNLVNAIQSLNTLEDKFAAKLEDANLDLDENDEVLRLRLENVRLNEENSSLVNSKQKVEADMNNRIEDLTKKLFIKNEECEEIHRKYCNLLSSMNAQREEEIKAWIRRREQLQISVPKNPESTLFIQRSVIITGAIEELRRQMRELVDKRNSSLAMKDEEQRLTIEEVKLLRGESDKQQKFWDNQFAQWVKEKRGLQEEIKTLRSSFEAVEGYYNQMTEIRSAQSRLLEEQRLLTN